MGMLWLLDRRRSDALAGWSDGVVVDPFVSDGVIEYRGHHVANLAPGPRRKSERVQPLFDLHGPHV